jgi:hypothetical protein
LDCHVVPQSTSERPPPHPKAATAAKSAEAKASAAAAATVTAAAAMCISLAANPPRQSAKLAVFFGLAGLDRKRGRKSGNSRNQSKSA